jgi:pyruvate dehydrogenase E2 component (dihydrolipoamide acetyltransferase)
MSIGKLLDRLPDLPMLDFSTFGDVEIKSLSSIQHVGGGFLARNWIAVPHVTHHDEADVTELEQARSSNKSVPDGTKVAFPVVLIKALVVVLQEFPKFNASLDSSAKNLILKKYFNIGVAVDTPKGLLVPVFKGCDRKSIDELSKEFAEKIAKARDKGLSIEDMSGGSFTLSWLGGLGGTGFTPIINVPEVAILGTGKLQTKPTRGPDDGVVWRQFLPLSLSYDHRVINGADAATFLTRLAAILAEPKRLLA